MEKHINTSNCNITIGCNNMEVAITKMSQNGQVVIPMEVRKDAKLKPFTKFIVLNKGGTIILKPVHGEKLIADLELLEAIARGEEDIRKGRVTNVDSKMSAEEILKLLTP